VSDQHRIVIVGGGFAGLSAAKVLKRSPVRVTLIDRAAHHLFQPMLYQCAAGALSEGQIAPPLRAILRRHANVDCLLGEVVDIDLDRRVVRVERPLGTIAEIPYDSLIVGAGVSQSYFGHDEFAQFAPGMKTIADALTVRRRIYGAFEMAESAADESEREGWLTFALVGAGPTGVELAGQIREVADHAVRGEYRQIDPPSARVMLFDGGALPLANFGEGLAERAERSLRRIGVELHMHSMVTGIDAEGLDVKTADGAVTRFAARTVLWTAGVAASPVAARLAEASGAPVDRAGRIMVEPDCTIPGYPDVFAVGDMMHLEDLPGLAEVAMQSGRYAAQTIRRRVEGKPARKKFRYRDLGSMAYISRHSAVVSLHRIKLSGRLAWWTWLVVHIATLTTWRNRLSALGSWLIVFARRRRNQRTMMTTDLYPTSVHAPSDPPLPG
jgi:NADH dehydrogenase